MVISMLIAVLALSVSATTQEENSDNIQPTIETDINQPTVETESTQPTEETDSTVVQEKVTIAPKKLKLATQEVKEVTVKKEPASQEAISVKWQISNKKVATVKKGKVTGKALGKATIKGTVNNTTASCTVTVNRTTTKTIIGKKLSLLSLVKNIENYKNGSWKTSNKKIATVNGGKLKEKAEGTCKITYTAPDKTKYGIMVEVVKVSLNKEAVNVYHNGSVKLKLNNAFSDVKWSTANKKVATVNGKGKVKAVKRGKTTITATCFGVKFKCAVRVYGTKLVAITFDDGPSIYTQSILDTFKKYDSKATFFVVGNRLAGNEDLLKKMINEGHEIGNHSWSHSVLSNLSYSGLTSELKNTSDKIKKATGKKPTLMRPPYGACNTSVKNKAKELGMAVINWSVDTLDWKTRNQYSVANVIMSQTTSGKIVLCHDLYSSTSEAMKTIVPQLVKKGYDLVTVSELLKSDGGKATPGEVYFNR